jgi:hypothetical protein
MAALHAGEHRPVRIANPAARLSRTHWSRLRCAEIKAAKAGSQTLCWRTPDSNCWSHGRRPASMGRYRLGFAPTISRCRKSGWKRHEAVLRAWSCHVGPTVRIRLPPGESLRTIGSAVRAPSLDRCQFISRRSERLCGWAADLSSLDHPPGNQAGLPD